MRTFVHKVILFAFLLTACQPTGQIEITPTGILPISTPLASVTLPAIKIPQLTFTQPPAELPTSVMGEHFIDLPEWVMNPDNNILLLPYLDDGPYLPATFRLVNPIGNEQVTIKLNWNFYFHYWRDSSHAVFLQEGSCEEDGPKYVAELNVSNGSLWQGKTEDYTEPIKDCYDFLGEKDIVLNRDLPEITIEFKSPTTAQTILLTNPNDGIGDVSYALSPDKNYIAVVQADGDYQPSDFWLPEYGHKISIFSLPERKLILTFDETERISSLMTFLDNQTLVYVRKGTPCIISLQSLEKKCVHAISEKFPESTVIVEGSLSTPRKLGFIYFDSSHGGICLYDLYSGVFNCPTDHFSSMDEQRIINHSLSPDGKFLLFEYDNEGCPVPSCDNFDISQWAVTDIEVNQLFELGDSDTGRYFIFRPIQPNPWRPFNK